MNKRRLCRYKIFIIKLHRWEFVELDERDTEALTKKAALAMAFENMGCVVESIKPVENMQGFYTLKTDMDEYECSVGFMRYVKREKV